MSDQVQFRHEMGGLAGRILLAVFLIIGISRVKLPSTESGSASDIKKSRLPGERNVINP